MKTLERNFRKILITVLLLFTSIGTVLADCEIVASEETGCENDAINFSATIPGGKSIATINWNFGDGEGSSNESPTHIYTNPGVFTLELNITYDDGTSCTKTMVIEIFANPEAGLSLDGKRDFCFHEAAEEGIQFIDESLPGPSGAPIVDWEWDFDDGVTSRDQHPIHQYTFSGNFRPSVLVIDDNGCTDEFILEEPINIGQKIELDFRASGTRTCDTSDFTFSNRSEIDLSNIDYFAWHMDDEDSAKGIPETVYIGGESDTALWNGILHRYSTDDGGERFSPRLVVIDKEGCTGEYVGEHATGNINYDMEISGDTICFGEEASLSFLSQARQNATYVEWEFGDPDAEDDNIEDEDWWATSHRYTGPGIYSIRYLIVEPDCFKEEIFCDYVYVKGPAAMIHDDEIENDCREPVTLDHPPNAYLGQGRGTDNVATLGFPRTVKCGPASDTNSFIELETEYALFHNVSAVFEKAYYTPGNEVKTDSTIADTIFCHELRPRYNTHPDTSEDQTKFRENYKDTVWNYSYVSNRGDTLNFLEQTIHTWEPGDSIPSTMYAPRDYPCNPLLMHEGDLYPCEAPVTIDFTNLSMKYRGYTEEDMFPFDPRGSNVHAYPNYPFGSADLQFTWDFGDGSPPSTAALPTHTYDEEGTYTVILEVCDPVTGCCHEDQLIIHVGPPDGSEIDLMAFGRPCAGTLDQYPFLVDLSDVEPSSPDYFWIVHDSAAMSFIWNVCGEDGVDCPEDSVVMYNWLSMEDLEMTGNMVNFTSPGWKSMGFVVKHGNCYDTTWRHNYIHISNADGGFEYTIDTTDGGSAKLDGQTDFLSYSQPIYPAQYPFYPVRNKATVTMQLLNPSDTIRTINANVQTINHHPDNDPQCEFNDTTYAYETPWFSRLSPILEGVKYEGGAAQFMPGINTGDSLTPGSYVFINLAEFQNGIPYTSTVNHSGNTWSQTINVFNNQSHFVQDTIVNYEYNVTGLTPSVGGDVSENFAFPNNINLNGRMVPDITDSYEHIFTQTGIYQISSAVMNLDTCADARGQTIRIGHYNHFRIAGEHGENNMYGDSVVCVGDVVEFRDSVYYFKVPDPPPFDDEELEYDVLHFYENDAIQYDLNGDGNIDAIQNSETEPITWTYDEPGSYEVTMYTTDTMGNQMINKLIVHVSQPVASFSMDDSIKYCAGTSGQVVQFFDQSAMHENIRHTSTAKFSSHHYLIGDWHGNVTDSNEVIIDSIASWHWTFGTGGQHSERRNPDRRYRENDTFEVNLTVRSTRGCVDHTARNVYILGPKPGFEVLSAEMTGCIPFNIDVLDTSDSWIAREWILGDGNTVSEPQEDSVRLTYSDTAGIFELTLRVVDSLRLPDGSTLNCPAIFPNPELEGQDTSILIKVLPTQSAHFTTEKDRYCTGEEVFFDNQTQDTINLHWFDDDDILSYSDYRWNFDSARGEQGEHIVFTNRDASYTYADTGDKVIWLHPQDGRCPDSARERIHIQDVGVGFDYNSDRLPIVGYFPTDETWGKDLDYFWEFGDGNTSEQREPVHEYMSEGSQPCPDGGSSKCFEVCLTVTDDIGCEERTCDFIRVETDFEIPNVFSPTGDGINDIFVVNVVGELEYKLIIYNRWGERVFETEDAQRHWNGDNMNTGEACEPGTYYYVVKYRLIGQETKRELSGTVTLLR